MKNVVCLLTTILLLTIAILPGETQAPKAVPPTTIKNPTATVVPDTAAVNDIQTDTFDSVATYAKLPKLIRDHIAAHAYRPLDPHMADPGRPWTDSDVLLDAKLPGQRLIFAAVDASYCIIAVAFGGAAAHHEVFIYRMGNKSATIVAGGYLPTLTSTYQPVAMNNLDDLRSVISKKQVVWDSSLLRS